MGRLRGVLSCEGRLGSAPAASFEEAGSIEAAVKAFRRDLNPGINALPPVAVDVDALELRFSFLTTWTLMRPDLTVDAETRAKSILEVDRTSNDAAWRSKRAAEGDNILDPRAPRFPSFGESKPAVALPTLFARWAAEPKPTGSTVDEARDRGEPRSSR